ncbi:rhomboid family intramembrane serine protease [Candidatus Enterococcus willemsii]|uniref:Rhomboid family intramembrane serine protease n=1 Tax=Candidatus Enterococcus willemsii TaxID=1857215 RepID=A0ABQ6YWE1_9ENTE|nr:rhomboid family intramembrane serine protease [Enterococcus sp. CU12B]KAF1301101.1 rhomboid family intramembrane serine protease [Enterococcus sp. CU12B]
MNQTIKRWSNGPFLTYLFLTIQTAVFLLAFLLPQLQLEFRGAMFGPLVVYNHEYWRFLTPIFIHYSLMHFAVNSVVLYFMGQQVEAIYGHTRFLFIYLLSGLAGNALSFAFNQMGVQSAGSSTSLFGLFGAFVILGIHFKNNLAIQAMVRQFALFVGMSLIFGFFDQSIDIFGHIGGFLGGALLGNIFGIPKNSRAYSIHVRIISGMIFAFLIVFCLFYGFKKYGML